jgi:hypothetical protein
LSRLVEEIQSRSHCENVVEDVMKFNKLARASSDIMDDKYWGR